MLTLRKAIVVLHELKEDPISFLQVNDIVKNFKRLTEKFYQDEHLILTRNIRKVISAVDFMRFYEEKNDKLCQLLVIMLTSIHSELPLICVALDQQRQTGDNVY